MPFVMPGRPDCMNLRCEGHIRAGVIWKQILSGLNMKNPLYQARADIPCNSE